MVAHACRDPHQWSSTYESWWGDQAALAFARFGKGRHASGLNFGDCFSYALAERLKAA